MKRLKWYTRVLCLLLSAVVVLTAAAGCGSGKDGGDAAEQSANGETTTVQASKEAEKDLPSWKKDTSPYTITWYVNRGWNRPWNAEAAVLKKITEDTGISIKVEDAPSNASQKFSTLIAANSLPDVITVKMGEDAADIQQLQANDRLFALNKLSDQFAPGFMKVLPKSMYNWWKFKDDNLYVYVNYFWAPENLQKYPDIKLGANSGMLVRKDLMEQAGLKAEDFDTQDGLIAALKKVKEMGLKYKENPVTPIYFGSEGGINDTLNGALCEMFGIPREDKDGNFIDYRFCKEYEEVVAFSNRLYREGLMSPENFTSQRKQIEDKYLQGTIFSFVGNTADVKGKARELLVADPNAYTIPVGPIKSASGSAPAFKTTGMVGWLGTAITKNAQKPERIIAFFDYMIQPEIQKLALYGIEGTHHKTGGPNGSLIWDNGYLEARNKDGNKTRLETGVAYFDQFIEPVQRDILDPEPSAEADIMLDKLFYHNARYVYNDAAFQGVEPSGDTEEAVMYKEIDTYFKREIVKAVISPSEEQALAVYRSMLAEIEKMGYPKVLQAMNAKYQENKKKTEQKFAFPSNIK